MVPGIGVDVISKRLCIPGPACVFNTESTGCIFGSMLLEAVFIFFLLPGAFAAGLVPLPLGW